MWVVKTEKGKFRMCERFPMPDRTYKVFSVTMEKNNAQTRKAAAQLLAARAGRATGTEFTLENVLAAYLRDQEKTVRPQTAKRNKTTLTRFVRFLGPRVPIADLSAGYCRQVLLKQNKPEGWRNEYIVRLKAMLRWAFRNDYIDNTLCADKLQLFTVPESSMEDVENKYLTSDELWAVIDALEEQPHWQLAAEFLVLTGLRFGEFAALLPEDFSPAGIRINKTYNETYHRTNKPKTYSSIRIVPIQEELAAVIREINLFVKKEKLKHPEIKKAPYWFPKIPNRRMKKLNNLHISIFAFDKAFKKVCEDITGKSLTAHGLRHTHASLLFEQGFTYDQVGRRLGHAGNSRVTREIYVHITEKLRIKDADAIQQIRLLS